MRSSNSRKGQTSITHLMNFSLPPRPQYHPSSRGTSRRAPTWGLGSGYHAVDKARYVINAIDPVPISLSSGFFGLGYASLE
jgi:hypothetical protein